MRIATWNVNGLRARLDFVRHWLAAREPDVVCLQELKLEDDQFPREELAALARARDDEDLALEVTYTGRTLAALLAEAADGRPGPTLLWNTFHPRGAPPADAVALLCAARDQGLTPRGVSFHVGSQCLEVGRYREALTRLSALRGPVDDFFDQVMVMCEDAALRRNRLALLRSLEALFLGVADISRLQ